MNKFPYVLVNMHDYMSDNDGPTVSGCMTMREALLEAMYLEEQDEVHVTAGEVAILVSSLTDAQLLERFHASNGDGCSMKTIIDLKTLEATF